MANLKDLKVRITSVKSTQKITKAMKMVAASKLRRAKERAEKADPYASRMQRMLISLATSMSENESAPKLLTGNGSDNVHLLIVISSDRGLCGGLNTNLIKAVKQKIKKLSASNKKFKIICIGRKGFDLLRNQYSSYIIKNIEGLTKKKMIHYQDAEEVAYDIVSMFENGDFDICSLFYNKFNSAISQEPRAQQIIPLDLNQDNSDNASNDNNDKSGSAKAVYEYEPNETAILNDLLPHNVAVQLFHGLLENIASEQGARMSAMDNATRNAGDMINKLTLLYNRTRQAAITTELTEIVAGAEAI